jgi:hypothetical protein
MVKMSLESKHFWFWDSHETNIEWKTQCYVDLLNSLVIKSLHEFKKKQMMETETVI